MIIIASRNPVTLQSQFIMAFSKSLDAMRERERIVIGLS